MVTFANSERRPDFNNLLNALRRTKTARIPLFEFFLNDSLISNLFQDQAKNGLQVYGTIFSESEVPQEEMAQANIELINTYHRLGYDYTPVRVPGFSFPAGKHGKGKTISLNEGTVISDWESFEKYPWPDPDRADYALLERLASHVPDGMKLIVWGAGGVLENVMSLVGYENLCYLVMDEPELVMEIFKAVGSRFVRYYENAIPYDVVGAAISNDDWGFKTQTMLSVQDMRKFVFPWHQKIVSTIHSAGKPAILHSCGQLEKIMDEVIDDLKYDAKHSFEDNIFPVELAYERWGSRIAILGGLDVDFLCRASTDEIYNRAAAMLERVGTRGGYALGSGNSIPDYVPDQHYLAMISAVKV